MSYILLIGGIALLVILIAWVRFNAFIAFLLVSLLIGLLGGLSIVPVIASIQKGIGDILGNLVIILGLGAMLGKIVADSGAALRISTGLIDAFGKKYIVWALVLTCFIIGIPLFYNVAFVLVVPFIITVAARYKLPAVYVGLPALSALIGNAWLPASASVAGSAGAAVWRRYGHHIVVWCAGCRSGNYFGRTLFAMTLKNIPTNHYRHLLPKKWKMQNCLH